MVKYIDFEIFENYPEVLAAFSTKEGGVSTGIYESMNLSLSSADEFSNIMENYKRFAAALGVCPEQFVISNQQHTTNIRITGKEDAGKGLFKERDYDAVDGFITNEKGLMLCLLFADCVPVYLYDPVKKAIALVHSGWKGTVGKISKKAVEMMRKEYGSEPESMVAAIGPSICQDCYEVSADLLDAFKEAFGEDGSRFFKNGRVTQEGEQKYQLSLWDAVKYTLAEAGLKEENVCAPEICTCCEHELLFSHRYTNGKRGNLAAVLALR